MRKITDLLGQKFGRLKVISLFGKDKYNNARWLCQCDCGNEAIVIGSELRRTNRIGTRSCGCLQKERREHYNKNCKKYNDFLITNGYVEVTLYNSPNKMLCDIDDWERLKEHCWYECGGYARTNKNKQILVFHKNVISDNTEKEIDHINRNRLDNRKCNLRIVNRSVNSVNKGLYKNNTSGIKGVYYDKRCQKWVARIDVCKKPVHLGKFLNIEEAKSARQKAEEKYFKPILEGGN